MKRKIPLILVIILSLQLLSCDYNEVAPEPIYTFELLTNEELSGIVGETLSPIKLKVKNKLDRGVPNVQLNIATTSGTITNDSPKSNSEGEVGITWTLGEIPGEQRLTITAPGEKVDNAPLELKAMVTQLIYRLDVVDVENQNQLNGIAGEPLNPFEIQVINAVTNQPVQEVEIAFKVEEGEGVINGKNSITAEVDGQGKVRAELTLGPKLFELHRVVASLAAGSPGTAESIEFTGLADKFRDSRDGQIYRGVKTLDGKIWMAENLNFLTWNSWCYDNNSQNCSKYGRLYTWDSAREACPPGWHLPMDNEWKSLAIAYGGYYDWETRRNIGNDPLKAYQRMMEGGDSGLAITLSGNRGSTGHFDALGTLAAYWTDNEFNANVLDGWYYSFNSYLGKPDRNNRYKEYGYSCRCVQN